MHLVKQFGAVTSILTAHFVWFASMRFHAPGMGYLWILPVVLICMLAVITLLALESTASRQSSILLRFVTMATVGAVSVLLSFEIGRWLVAAFST